MDVLAQVAQTHGLIAGVLLAKLGQDAPHGLIFGVIVLELLQRSQHAVPAALGDANGEHNKKTVQPSFFYHHAVLGQKFGHHAGRDASCGKPAIEVHTRRHDRRLDRVEHVEAGRHLPKPVPVHPGLGVGRLPLDDPVIGPPDALLNGDIRAPHLEPPVITIFFIYLAHGAPKVQRLGNALLDQSRAPGGLHHGRSDITTGNDAVLRRRAGVHQVGLIEEVLVEFDSL